MRTALTLAFAAVGVLSFAMPCAAQSGAFSVAPKSSSVSKSASPQRLSPPEVPVVQVQSSGDDKAAREDTAPTPAPEPQPEQSAPQAMAAPQAVRTQRITPDA